MNYLEGQEVAVSVDIIQADILHIAPIAPLFDQYRQFYRQVPDLPGVEAFLRDRLTGRQALILLAVNPATGAGAGFVQLYPSFSSIRLQPILILNDLFVARKHAVAGLPAGL